MGSLRAKQGSYIEILKAIQAGSLQGLTRPDRLLASQIWNTLNKMEYDADLKLYLPFDEASGVTAHDLSGTGNTGTANVDNVCDGVFGKARDFDGVDDVVNCGVILGFGQTDVFTCEIWAKPTSVASSGGLFGNLSTTQGYGMIVSGGKVQWYIRSSALDTAPTSARVYQDSSWHHLVLRYDGAGNANFWGDGLYDTDATGVQLEASGQSLLLGDIPGYSMAYAGILDEYRCYSRVLTDEEVQLHYLAGALKLGLI